MVILPSVVAEQSRMISVPAKDSQTVEMAFDKELAAGIYGVHVSPVAKADKTKPQAAAESTEPTEEQQLAVVSVHSQASTVASFTIKAIEDEKGEVTNDE